MSFIYFEIKKFICNPKNIVCLVILMTLFTGLLIINNTTTASLSSEAEYTVIQANLQQSKQTIRQLENELKLTPTNKKISGILSDERFDEASFSQQFDALENNDWDLLAKLRNDWDIVKIGQISDKNSDAYKSYLQNINYYQAVKKSGGKHGLIANETTEAAFTLGYLVTSWLSATTIFVLITVLIADSFSTEIESSQIRFYQLIRGNRTGHLLRRLFAPLLVTFTITVIGLSLLYLVNGLIGDFGTWQYPYLLANGTIEPIWKVTLITLMLFFFALVFIGSLGQLLALIFKKSLIVVGLIVVMFTGFLTVTNQEWFQPMKKFVPLEYLSYGQIINDTTILPKNPVLIGSIFILSLSLLFFIISAFLYQHYYYRKVVTYDRSTY
jgi:ABC-2 type transport system permease protein